MLLIIFLGLIAKLAFVSCVCDLGPSDVTDFDFVKVGINLLTRFLKQAAFKTDCWVYILFVIPSKNCP